MPSNSSDSEKRRSKAYWKKNSCFRSIGKKGNELFFDMQTKKMFSKYKPEFKFSERANFNFFPTGFDPIKYF